MPSIERVLIPLLAFAPGLSAQVVRQTDSVVVSAAVHFVTPRPAAGFGRRPPAPGGDESLLARAFDASGTPGQPFAGGLAAGLALDSVCAPERVRHAWLGAALGLGVGAGAGYLVAIPRVRATERHSDGPFQQIEYLLDPVIGGVIGSIVGAVVGSHVR